MAEKQTDELHDDFADAGDAPVDAQGDEPQAVAGDSKSNDSGESESRPSEPSETIALPENENVPNHPGRAQVTFFGNSYDLLSFGALITGGIILFSCLTCNMGYYCMPIIPIVLGLIGIITAHQAVEEKRTRLWSWLGVGAGGLILLLILIAFGLYVGMVIMLMAFGALQ